MRRMLWRVGALLTLSMLLGVNAQADRVSDIRNTRHNFSAAIVPALPEGAARNVQATSESQVCAFCHTPHGGASAAKAPIWNRKLSGQTYTPYSSTSLEFQDIGQPNTKSKLCLSCHDGTLAIGAVNVLNRVERPNVTVGGTKLDGTMPEGMGATTGFTRRLGVDLSNDHPISFTYNSARALRDQELRNPAVESHIGTRAPGERPLLPLDDGNMECVTCHDPHIRSTEGENIKFLRVNRFQKAQPAEGAAFDRANDIICLACHEKAGWALSAHANADATVAGGQTYTDAAAELRDFPKGMKVWQAACLNCHDPHTVQGSRRILREGTDGNPQITTKGARFKQGGKAAIEETCYACHSADGNVLQGQGAGSAVPDIKTDFTTMRIHMPIASSDQPAQEERHSIGSTNEIGGGKDFLESRERLGNGDLTNRHAECTDCHNPHRVTKNRLFYSNPAVPDNEGTHNHTAAQIVNDPTGKHSNIASGVLRGSWGVEPYGWPSTAFDPNQMPIFEVKRGDPSTGVAPATLASNDDRPPETYVTREYQVCMKCHSNYGYGATPPPLGLNHSGGTPPGTNSLFNYTNQAVEYQSPDAHKAEFNDTAPASPTGAYVGGTTCANINTGTMNVGAAQAGVNLYDNYYNPSYGGYLDPQGNCVNYREENHRSWHPAMRPTGRTAVANAANPGVRNFVSPADNQRQANANDWLEPFNAGVGVQTMYCTDCHGSDTAAGTTVPRGTQPHGNVWGPHGSNNNFLLKGAWEENTGTNTPDALCFKCHNYDYYGKSFPQGNIAGGTISRSGFSREPGQATGAASCLYAADDNLHIGHAQTGQVSNFRCNFCHIAIPHGWKNKNFLANLNDIGAEAGLTAGTQVRNRTTARYYRGPYYNGSVLKVVNFRRSGAWVHTSCGSAGTPGNGRVGGNNNFGNIPWMTDPGADSEACNNIP